MPRPYSIDLRSRVVAALDKLGVEETAEQFQVGTATVKRWRRRKVEAGTLAPKPHGGGNPARVQGEERERVRRLVAEHPDWSIEEVAEAWASAAHASISRSSMGRTLQLMGLTRKKKS